MDNICFKQINNKYKMLTCTGSNASLVRQKYHHLSDYLPFGQSKKDLIAAPESIPIDDKVIILKYYLDHVLIKGERFTWQLNILECTGGPYFVDGVAGELLRWWENQERKPHFRSKTTLSIKSDGSVYDLWVEQIIKNKLNESIPKPVKLTEDDLVKILNVLAECNFRDILDRYIWDDGDD